MPTAVSLFSTRSRDDKARREHGRLGAAVFALKAIGLRLRRGGRNLFSGPGRPQRLPVSVIPAQGDENKILGTSVSPLWGPADADHGAEFLLTAGKVQNLRVARRRVDGATLRAGQTFSFWAQLGRPTWAKGYVPGRELREGCLVPAIGGGLCQLSNALYDAALQAGFEILERHAHTRVVPGSLAERGRDATVFWNYVDLRFRPTRACRIEVTLSATELTVRLRAPDDDADPTTSAPGGRGVSKETLPRLTPDALGSCASCGVESCFRHLGAPSSSPSFTAADRNGPRTAFLVDDCWPEFDAYLQQTRHAGDLLFRPLDGRRWRRANYAWQETGFGKIHGATLTTLHRAWTSRRLASQGAARQTALLRFEQRLAARYARRLAREVTVAHLVVAQNLLPFLWRAGALAGRSFDVLLTRPPFAELHAHLDEATRRHPDSPTLGDFRAPTALVEAESAALAAARRLVTPHAALTARFGARAQRLPWCLPTLASGQAGCSSRPPSNRKSRRVLFPATTVGRKGAYELRTALRRLSSDRQIELAVTSGASLEGTGFWDGLSVVTDGRLAEADVVVLPAWVENRPRRLLAAVAAGIPVVASEACGLDPQPGVVWTIPAGDVDALGRALTEALVTAKR